jgi:hypothetical protein
VEEAHQERVHQQRVDRVPSRWFGHRAGVLFGLVCVQCIEHARTHLLPDPEPSPTKTCAACRWGLW